MFRLSDGEEIMTLASFVLIQYWSVTDGRTDIPPLAIPAVCIACYANALVKIAATRCHNMLQLKCTKFDFGWGSVQTPLGELTALLQTPLQGLAGFKGPTSKVCVLKLIQLSVV